MSGKEIYIDNDYLFYCSHCHQIHHFESEISGLMHIDRCNQEKLSEEQISNTYDQAFAICKPAEENGVIKIEKSVKGIGFYVYELGKFLYQHMGEIKNKPIHVIQVPFYPDLYSAKFDPTVKIEDLLIDKVIPSSFCQISYPCQHMVYYHVEGESWDIWHQMGKMRGNEIWKKYEKFLPKHLVPHFKSYDCMICNKK